MNQEQIDIIIEELLNSSEFRDKVIEVFSDEVVDTDAIAEYFEENVFN